MIQAAEAKPSRLERFGVYYLNLFNRIDSKHNVFDLTDAELKRRVNRISRKGIVLSSLVGIICVFPTVWVDVHFTNSPFVVHYGWVAGVTLVSVLIEFYVLFLIALKAVHEVSELINLHATSAELGQGSLFSVTNILARAALELPDPELKILGIDPFKQVPKKNLFILGLLYKAKIFVTNFVLKYGLKAMSGNEIGGISVLYEALPVEAFWNSVVIERVVHEARLRLFGFALAHQIGKNVLQDHILEQLSPEARTGCLRAIGNALVMAQNYHPNMIILLLRFKDILQENEEHQYDDWDLFLDTLNKVTPRERLFLLDLFTLSAAFDGRLSHLVRANLKSAYGKEYELYYPRLVALTEYLKKGQLNAALGLCRFDSMSV